MIRKKDLQVYIKQCEYASELEKWYLKYLLKPTGYPVFKLLMDIASHGCSSGILPEFISNHDCIQFYNKHKSDIWEFVYKFRSDTVMSLGQFFDSFQGMGIEDPVSMKVQLVWFAIEQMTYQITSYYFLSFKETVYHV